MFARMNKVLYFVITNMNSSPGSPPYFDDMIGRGLLVLRGVGEGVQGVVIWLDVSVTHDNC